MTSDQPNDSEASSSPARSSAFPDFDKDLQREIAHFVSRTEKHLRAINTDFLSDTARKDQRLLLAIAFCLLFISRGVIAIGGNEIHLLGLKLTVSGIHTTLLTLGLMVCAYFEIVYAIRCFSAWASYRLQGAVAERRLWIERIAIVSRVKPFEESREGLKAAWDASGPTPTDAGSGLLAAKRSEHIQAMRILKEKQAWMARHLLMVRVSTTSRIIVEIFGPLAFGAYALIAAHLAIT
jgi:hypothetical protein